MLKVANFTMPKIECTRKNRKKPLCRPTLIKYLLIDNCATTTEKISFSHTSILLVGNIHMYRISNCSYFLVYLERKSYILI